MLSVLNLEHAASVKFSVERGATMPARVVLRGQATRGSRLILIAGYDGPELPERLTDVVVEPADSGEQAWCLRCGEGEFRFRASAVERLEGRPEPPRNAFEGCAHRGRAPSPTLPWFRELGIRR